MSSGFLATYLLWLLVTAMALCILFIGGSDARRSKRRSGAVSSVRVSHTRVPPANADQQNAIR